MTIQEYISSINSDNKTGITTEISFRTHLQNLIKTIVPDVTVIHEPKHQAVGAPDYILTKQDIPLCYIETKILATDLHNKAYKEQFDRYKTLPKLIITNYLDFEFYEFTELVATYSIGEKIGNKIVAKLEHFNAFETIVKNYSVISGQTIKSPESLAKLMANNARVLADVIYHSLLYDIRHENDSALNDQLKAFQQILIHDLTTKEFSDIFAQTIAYGMFSARLHDPTLETFTRREAAELIPKTNPFLRNLFDHIAGIDLDKRILWIVDALVDIFRATDVKALLKNFYNAGQKKDPIIYFYETFLSEYDPNLRKNRGVWYTPESVVKFIVNAVDDVLKNEFSLIEGLANTDKIEIKIASKSKATSDQRSKLKDSEQKVLVHKVQILDPATGTGTFLAEVIKHIYRDFENQKGAWSNYVENHLLPRINGFELLMASYAMAHLKLDMLLTQTGYKPKNEQRLRVYLTNSLEKHHPDTGNLFASMLSREANEANYIKRDIPVMVVMGNPPYSGISYNKNNWIDALIEEYKYTNGEHFNEQKHWLNDDYVKFIRLGQYFIEKNGSGILAFINPHGFLDNTTFRGMRWNLLKAFDKIYTLDLHGNSKKSETAVDGSKDQNVFGIMQGVSINIFIKTGIKKDTELGKVFHSDLFGKQEMKYSFLEEKRIADVQFKELTYSHPNYFFVPKDFKEQSEYDLGFSISELFQINVTGIVTARDKFVINENKTVLLNNIKRFTDRNFSDDEIRNIFFGNKKEGQYLAGDSRGWKLIEARKKISTLEHETQIKTISYRPFDDRFIYYNSDMVDWGREKFMAHFIKGDNYGLMTCRQIAIDTWAHVGLTKYIADDSRVSNRTKERGYIFPLYLYAKNTDELELVNNDKRIPNLSKKIVNQLSEKLGMIFTDEKEDTANTYSPIDILDYIYAILHSPSYREHYREFLKIDFPRIPYPKDVNSFFGFVKLGGELRQIHLLESHVLSKPITPYSVAGDNIVSKIVYKGGTVYINETQYFAGVPQIAWDSYIGGYQPAQKWLKDRKGKELSYEDIKHYQKIIVALTETDRIMKEIDKIAF